MGREPTDSEALILRGGKSKDAQKVPLEEQLTQENTAGDLLNRRVVIQRKGSQEPAISGLLLDVRRQPDQSDSLIQVLIAYPANNDFGHAITQATIDLHQTNLKLAKDLTAQHLERTRISFHQNVLETSIPVSSLIGKRFTMRSRKTGKTEEIRLHGFVDLFNDRRTQSTFLIARAADRLGGFVLIDTAEHIIQEPIEDWDASRDNAKIHQESGIKSSKTCHSLISRLISILGR
jgi:hypothetical protein